MTTQSASSQVKFYYNFYRATQGDLYYWIVCSAGVFSIQLLRPTGSYCYDNRT